MDWFKILLLIWVGLGVIAKLALTAGWTPKPLSRGWYAFTTVEWAFFFVCILLWVTIAR